VLEIYCETFNDKTILDCTIKAINDSLLYIIFLVSEWCQDTHLVAIHTFIIDDTILTAKNQ